MAKKELTAEQIKEKEQKKLDKEREAKEKLQAFKNAKYFEKISDDVLIKFILKLEKDYEEIPTQDALELLFKNFANGKFKFSSRKIWE